MIALQKENVPQLVESLTFTSAVTNLAVKRQRFLEIIDRRGLFTQSLIHNTQVPQAVRLQTRQSIFPCDS